MAHQYPGALLSHRTALEFKPSLSGEIFITYKYTKNIVLPGITVRSLKGKGPVTGAKKEQIIAVPTLIRQLPAPIRILVGDLSDKEKVLVGLNIKPA